MISNLIILFHFFNFTLGMVGLILISRRVSLVSADVQKSFILQALFYNITIILTAVINFQDYFFWDVVKGHIAALSIVYLLTIINLAVFILWAFFFIQMVYKILNMPIDLTRKSWLNKTAMAIGSYLVILLFVRIFRIYRLLYPYSTVVISIIISLIVLSFSIYLYRKANEFRDADHKKALKIFGFLFAVFSVLILFVNLNYLVIQILPSIALSFSSNALDLIYNCIVIFWAFRYMDSLSTKEDPITMNNDSFDKIAAKHQISKRELEVIKLICEGRSNQEIADILFISLGTVKNHLYNIYNKIGIKNRTQLAKLF